MKRILAINDVFGCEDDDRELIESFFARDEVKIKFTTDHYSLGSISGFDIVTIDYGGVGLGMSGLEDSIRRCLLKAIEDNPSVDFFILSNLPDYMLMSELEDVDYPNAHVGADRLRGFISNGYK